MKKRIILFSLSIRNLSILSAQRQSGKFYNSLGGPAWELGQSVCQTKDGGYIISGRTSSRGSGGEDAWLIRTNASGDTTWTRTLGGPSDDYGYTVRIAPDGGYVVSGHTASFGHGDCDGWMFKTDSSGRLIWMNTYGTPMSEVTPSFNFTNDGGYVLIGFHGDDDDSLGVVYMVKTDINGDTLWTKYYGNNKSNYGFYVCQTADSGYVFTGLTNNYDEQMDDVLLCKADKKGNLLWTKTFGGDSNDIAYCLQITPDGGYIIAGWTSSYGHGSEDGWVIRTDASGNKVWDKTYGGAKSDRFNHIEPTSDGGYICSGVTYSFSKNVADMWIVKIDSIGNQQWMKTFGDTADQMNGEIKQCADKGYVIIGSTSNNCQYTADYNVLLIKTDSNGNGLPSPESYYYNNLSGIPILQQSDCSFSNYPNPFNIQTIFQFEINQNVPVSIVLYDFQGRKLADICTNAIYPAGNYTLSYHSADLAPGAYFAVMYQGNDRKEIKLIKE